jgi:hypothetical protein
MQASQFTAGEHLRALDLNGQAVQAQISAVTVKDFDEGQKLVLGFVGRDQTLVLNKTNTNVVIDLYGGETDDWIGRVVEVYPTRVDFGGKQVDALRLRPPVAPAAPLETPVVQTVAAQPAADPNAEVPW